MSSIRKSAAQTSGSDEPLFSNFTPLRRAKQRLTVLTSGTALSRRKMAAPGWRDATTKRSRRVVPREVSEILARKFYQVFDLLEVSAREGAGGRGEGDGREGGDVIGVEKGRHENAALSSRPSSRTHRDPAVPSLRARRDELLSSTFYTTPGSPIAERSRPGISLQ